MTFEVTSACSPSLQCKVLACNVTVNAQVTRIDKSSPEWSKSIIDVSIVRAYDDYDGDDDDDRRSVSVSVVILARF